MEDESYSMQRMWMVEQVYNLCLYLSFSFHFWNFLLTAIKSKLSFVHLFTHDIITDLLYKIWYYILNGTTCGRKPLLVRDAASLPLGAVQNKEEKTGI